MNRRWLAGIAVAMVFTVLAFLGNVGDAEAAKIACHEDTVAIGDKIICDSQPATGDTINVNPWGNGSFQATVRAIGICSMWIEVTKDNGANVADIFFQGYSVNAPQSPSVRSHIGPDCSPSVGGIAELPDVAGTPLEAPASSRSNAAVLAGIAAAVAAGAVALGGAAWYARRRLR